MSYESMKQTADLDYSLELGVGMPEHGMLRFSVGVVRMDGRRPYGSLLLLTVYDNGGQRLWRGPAHRWQRYFVDMLRMHQRLHFTRMVVPNS